MPELPDLEVFSHNLNRFLQGRTLEEFSGKGKGWKPVRDALREQTLTRVYRQGKELRFAFSGGNCLGIHLMLNGKLVLSPPEELPKKFLVELRFKDGPNLFLTDPRKMARYAINPVEKDAPDALSLPTATLKKILAGTKAQVKKVMTDQSLIQGIGNAYADEILWKAGISPFSLSVKIPPEAVVRLAKTIPRVLRDAIKQIRKTHPDIVGGEVRDFLRIHGRVKSPTGKPIHRKGGASLTYYTREQKLYQ